jgi:hypothetical protein
VKRVFGAPEGKLLRGMRSCRHGAGDVVPSCQNHRSRVFWARLFGLFGLRGTFTLLYFRFGTTDFLQKHRRMPRDSDTSMT